MVIEHLRSIEDDDIQSHLGIILGDDVALHVLSAGESDAAGLDIGLNVGAGAADQDILGGAVETEVPTLVTKRVMSLVNFQPL